MIATLAELIAPLSETEFRALLAERKLLYRRGGGDNRFAGLMDWEKLTRILRAPGFPQGSLRVLHERQVMNPMFYSEGGGPALARIERLMGKGASLSVVPLETLDPDLAALHREIGARIPEKIQFGAIVSTGTAGAYPPHYDEEDLIILQIEGSKRWRIQPPTVSNPARGFQHLPVPDAAPVFDEILEPGDFLFVPAGYWHHCENGPGRSLHLGVFFEPPVAWRAVYDLAFELLQEEDFRIPLSRRADAAEIAEALRSRLIEKVRHLSFGGSRT